MTAGCPYVVGDSLYVEVEVADPFDGTALTPTDVVATVKQPGGTTSTPPVTNPATGTYRFAMVITEAGTGWWRIEGTGNNADFAVERMFCARASSVV